MRDGGLRVLRYGGAHQQFQHQREQRRRHKHRPEHVDSPQHVVIVEEENHSYADIAGNPDAPYLNSLMSQGANLTQMFSITHPSQPNYIALFSGSTQGVTSDACPHQFSAQNLASELHAAHRTFTGYAEGLPQAGFTGCNAGQYDRKHLPWTNFTSVPAAESQPLTSLPTDFTRLPDLSYVIPDEDHNMHDGTVRQADDWLRVHLGAYATWARTHHSLLIVAWDEDDRSADNQIPTIAVGQGVQVGDYSQHADLYSLLRTIEDLFGLAPLGASAQRSAIAVIRVS